MATSEIYHAMHETDLSIFNFKQTFTCVSPIYRQPFHNIVNIRPPSLTSPLANTNSGYYIDQEFNSKYLVDKERKPIK